jgi:hypothetical protein
MSRKTPHNHQDVHTSVLRECNDANCKLPFRIAFNASQQEVHRAKRVPRRSKEDAMYRYAKLVYDTDRF